MSLPIRVRLTAWYAALVTAVITALAAFVVVRLRTDLGAEVHRDVAASSAQIAYGYAREGAEEFLDVSQTVLPGRGSVSQVLDPGGRVLLTYGDVVSSHGILPAQELARVAAGEPRTLVLTLGPDGRRFRVVAAPVRRLGRRRVVVVGESLQRVGASVDRLIVLLLLAGPAALGATVLGGWWLARKALTPVERMTSEAEDISIDRLHERVAVPAAQDEIGHLAVTLNAMLQRLEHGVAEKRRMVADASHELRTPLAVMRAELDVTLRGDEVSDEARLVLESVREEVDKMSRTVDNLLTLAEADEGRLGLLLARVLLRELIESAARPLQPLAAARRVTLTVECDEDVEVQADAQRLHQLLTNLIENAIKFAAQDGSVSVEGWRRAGEVGVTVTDDGPGIPAQARAHVFDRFYRLDGARRRDVGGSGLGLAICHEIATAHGARLWVESDEGAGSAFSVALPVGTT
jgi:heavy metal sensor kinase